MNTESKDYRRGWSGAQEDRAIGAGWAYPDLTLPEDYRRGYVDGWNAAADEEDARWSDQ